MAQLRKFGSGLAGVLGVGLCVFLSPPAVERYLQKATHIWFYRLDVLPLPSGDDTHPVTKNVLLTASRHVFFNIHSCKPTPTSSNLKS